MIVRLLSAVVVTGTAAPPTTITYKTQPTGAIQKNVELLRIFLIVDVSEDNFK